MSSLYPMVAPKVAPAVASAIAPESPRKSRLHRFLWAIAPASAALAVSACGPEALEAPSLTTGEAVVAQHVFERALEVVSGVEYLPFAFRIDGCYARALYMSMELAAQGIESNSIFAFANPSYPLKVGDVSWSYHVAPMLEVIAGVSVPVEMVIDPSISRSPLTADEWLTAMGQGPIESLPRERAPQVVVVPGSRYSPGGAASETTWRNRDIPSFTDLPPFQVADVQNACGVMHSYLAYEPEQASPEVVEARRQRLLSRTGELISVLDAEGKLEGSEPFSAETCAETQIDPFAWE